MRWRAARRLREQRRRERDELAFPRAQWRAYTMPQKEVASDEET